MTENLDQSRSNILFFLFGIFEKIWGAMRNCGKWSEIVVTNCLILILERAHCKKYYQ